MINNLEILYNDLHKHLLLAKYHSNNKYLPFIIKACRLKPLSFIYDKINYANMLHRHWVDEFGNTLYINKDKTIKINKNYLIIEREKLICTDLYYNATMEKISKISHMAYIFSGKDDQINYYIISFLGIDNYLRTYYYDGVWQHLPSLHLGIDILNKIAEDYDTTYFMTIAEKNDLSLTCENSKQWLTSIPVSQEFKDLIKDDEPIYNLIKGL